MGHRSPFSGVYRAECDDGAIVIFAGATI